MAHPGRIACGRMTDEFGGSIEMHVSGSDLASWFPYSQLNARRTPVWHEMWRLRSAVSDVLVASNGYQLKQKDVDRALVKLWKKLQPTIVPDVDGLEKVGFRVRTLMMQARNAKMGMWTLPTRYQALKGMFQLARVEGPPIDAPAIADDAVEDGIIEFDELQQLDDSNASESEVELVADSSKLTLGSLSTLLGDIFKPKTRMTGKSPSISSDSFPDIAPAKYK